MKSRRSSNADWSKASPVGQTVLMRAPVWADPLRVIAAIVTSVKDADEIELAGAQYMVSVTAFPPGKSPETLQRVPLFDQEPSLNITPAAWPRA